MDETCRRGSVRGGQTHRPETLQFPANSKRDGPYGFYQHTNSNETTSTTKGERPSLTKPPPCALPLRLRLRSTIQLIIIPSGAHRCHEYVRTCTCVRIHPTLVSLTSLHSERRRRGHHSLIRSSFDPTALAVLAPCQRMHDSVRKS